MTTPRPDLTAARDALAVALREVQPPDPEWAEDAAGSVNMSVNWKGWAAAILAALPDGWTLARAEAGVSVEALRQAFLDIEYPEVFADGESRRLSAALAARSAGSGSRVERVMPEGASFAWHSEQHGPDAICGGCVNHIGWHMEQCRCKEAPWCVPHPADGIHQWRSMCRLPHEHVTRPTPPPAVDGTRCGECGGVKDDVFHVPCLVGGPFHYVKTCHPFTPPTPAPDRLRALEALVEAIDYCHKTRHLRHSDGDRGADCYCGVIDALDAARALLAPDGEGSRS